MKATKRFVIIEEATEQEIASHSESKFCPFTPDNQCKKSDCMMFVEIEVRDAENPETYYQSTGWGRCGLVNIPVQSRMFVNYHGRKEREYFIGEIEPDGGQMLTDNETDNSNE